MVSHLQRPWQSALAEGKSAFASGDYTNGQNLFTSALSLAHEENAPEADIGELFYELGCCLVAAGDTATGRQRLNQALRTFERAMGTTSPNASMVRNQLASLDISGNSSDSLAVTPAQAPPQAPTDVPGAAEVARPSVAPAAWTAAVPVELLADSLPAASTVVHVTAPVAAPLPAAAPVSYPAPVVMTSQAPAAMMAPAPSIVPSAVPVAQPYAPPGAMPVAEPYAAPGAMPVAEPYPVPGAMPVAEPHQVSSAPHPQAKAQATAQAPAGARSASSDVGPGGIKRIPKTIARGSDPSYDQIMADRPPIEAGPIFVEEFIHPREKLYGFWTAAIGIWFYCLLTLCLVGFAIAPLALLAAFISSGIHLGHLRSKGIKVSDRQFPEVHDLVDQYSTAMNMQSPEVYVVQEHGLLNAFANRLHRKDFIVIYSDVVELAYAMGEKEMAFVVCHELAHIKRGHVKWAWVHMPGEMVPFLGTAYSRACEYTCDRVAAEIVPDGALFGLVCLAAGTKLYRRVNLKALYEQAEEEWGFWTWFNEIQATHPNLMNRIRAIGLRDQAVKGFHAAAAKVG